MITCVSRDLLSFLPLVVLLLLLLLLYLVTVVFLFFCFFFCFFVGWFFQVFYVNRFLVIGICRQAFDTRVCKTLSALLRSDALRTACHVIVRLWNWRKFQNVRLFDQVRIPKPRTHRSGARSRSRPLSLALTRSLL